MNLSKFFLIKNYYEKVVIPLNPKRFKLKETGSKVMMVCPFHSDHDPSLGIIQKSSGEEICHCFGCNYIGDIVKLNKDIQNKYFGKVISEEDSLGILCNTFGVDRNSLPVETLSSVADIGIRQESQLLLAMEDFDIGDFRYMIKQGKKEKKGISYFNTMLMLMIDKYKDQE